MNIDLCTLDWRLVGAWPYTPVYESSFETAAGFMGVTPEIPATVPGGVHADLLRAGLISDPYFERDSMLCEWVENRWWVYSAEFSLPQNSRRDHAELVFLGLDYTAHIFLNNKKLCVHEGMFEAVRLDVTDELLFDAPNTLRIIFESVPDEQAQIGYTSKTAAQKSRFNYKWDFSTRLVNIGIWDRVFLRLTGSTRISRPHVSTHYDGDTGYIRVSTELEGARCTAKITVLKNGQVAATHTQDCYRKLEHEFALHQPELWYPAGHGGQPLYDVTITLTDSDNAVLDEWACKTGIRSLEYRKCDAATDTAIEYVPVINGRDIYIRGVNTTPLDHLYGNITREDYKTFFDKLRGMNVNLVRIWGGGIIEKEEFYQLADEYGILVWQEFIQSSSGLENHPNHSPEFLRLLSRAATDAVIKRRNHVSLVFWSGGNELTGIDITPVGYGNENIAMLKDIVDKHDPCRKFLPTSPSGPSFGYIPGRPDLNHDIHGNWKYEGITQHYQRYNGFSAMLHSEFGCDGMSSLRQLKRIFSPENIRLTTVSENLSWRHHGQWWDTIGRDTEIFGGMPDIETFIKRSQYMQAEGLRYIVESDRRMAMRCAGTMIWQFNEPYPNASCTCVYQHNGQPKQAYYAVKNAYAPVAVSLKYASLAAERNKEFTAQAYITSINSGQTRTYWECLDICGNILASGSANAEYGENTALLTGEISFTPGDLPNDIFFVRLFADNCEDNIYMFGIINNDQPIFSGIHSLPECNLEVNNGTVTNNSDIACLFLRNDEAGNNNIITLFPGRSAMLSGGRWEGWNGSIEI